jgi:hypothetical protein
MQNSLFKATSTTPQVQFYMLAQEPAAEFSNSSLKGTSILK